MLFCENGPELSSQDWLSLGADSLVDGLQVQRCQSKKEKPSGNMGCLLIDIQTLYESSASLPPPAEGRVSFSVAPGHRPLPPFFLVPSLPSFESQLGDISWVRLFPKLWHPLDVNFLVQILRFLGIMFVSRVGLFKKM